MKTTDNKKPKRPTASISMPDRSENDFLIRDDAHPAKETEAKPKKRTVKTSPTAKSSTGGKSTAKKATAVSAPAQKRSATAGTGSKKSSARKKAVEVHPEDEVLREAIEIGDPVETTELLPEEEPAQMPAEPAEVTPATPVSDELEVVPEDQPEWSSVEEAIIPKKSSAFRLRRSRKKEEEPAQEESVIERIHRKSGLSEEDVTMMFELGYENELGRLVGYETMKKLRFEHLRRSSQSERRHYRTAFGYRGEEYVSAKQNEAIRAAYETDRRLLLHRVLLTALLCLVTIFLEFPRLLGTTVNDFAIKHPRILPFAAVLCLIVAAALSCRQLYAGARSMLRFTPTPYSMATVTVPTAALFALLNLLPSVQTPPLCTLTLLLLLALCIGDVLRITGEIRAFRIVSAQTEKTVLERTEPRKKKLMRGNKIVRIVGDDVDDGLYRVLSTEQTTGFFRRFNTFEYASFPLSVLIGASFAAAILAGFVTALVAGNLSSALTAATTMLLISTPVSLIFTFFYPLTRANAVLERRNCTLVGDEAAEEYAQEQTVIFADTDLFTAQKRAQIAVREGDEFRHDLGVADVILRRLGGSLAGIGGSLSRSYADPPVSFLRITQDGLEAVVDQRAHVLLGSAEFLRRSGIHTPHESTDEETRREAGIGVTYVAIDGLLRLSYEIQYRPDPEFEGTLRLLCTDGVLVAVRSYDPNLTDELLRQLHGDLAELLTALRPGRFEEETVQEVVDTGAVALGRRRDIALPLHAAKCIRKARRRGFHLQLAASIGGAAAAVLLTVFDRTGILTPLTVALYQGLCCTASILSARTALSRAELDR